MSSCSSKLEREDIPILWGMTLFQDCDIEAVEANIKKAQAFGLRGCLIEIPLVHPRFDSLAYRHYEKNVLDTILCLFKKGNISYGVSFSIHNPEGSTLENTDYEHLLTNMSAVLLKTRAYLPSHIIFSKELIDKPYLGQLVPLVNSFKKEMGGFDGEIVYASNLEGLQDGFDWSAPDIVGVIHHAPAEENYKEWFRQAHTALSDSAIKYNKPLLIVQTNLIGDNKFLLFKNQLRFWNDSVMIKGLSLNTVFCDMSLNDTLPYFGLANEEALVSYLKSYTRGRDE